MKLKSIILDICETFLNMGFVLSFFAIPVGIMIYITGVGYEKSIGSNILLLGFVGLVFFSALILTCFQPKLRINENGEIEEIPT